MSEIEKREVKRKKRGGYGRLLKGRKLFFHGALDKESCAGGVSSLGNDQGVEANKKKKKKKKRGRGRGLAGEP